MSDRPITDSIRDTLIFRASVLRHDGKITNEEMDIFLKVFSMVIQ